MRRIVVWLASTVTVVVLLFGYHTSTDKTSGGTPTSSASSPVAPADEPGTSSPTAVTTTHTGSVAQTRWGPVQVRITVTAGRVTRATVLQQPTGNPRDAEINARALPTLTRETVAAQSADIDMVSGATVTSEDYLQSLQAALDDAGI